MTEGMQINPVVLNGHGDVGAEAMEIEADGAGRIGVLSAFSPAVRRRVAALRKLQIDSVNVEAEYYKAIHELEVEFQKKFQGLNARRRQLVNGESEPTDEEGNFSLFNPGEEELAEQFQKMCVEEDKEKKPAADEKGVPKFWLNTLQNLEPTAEMIQENDEDLLAHLTDITSEVKKDPMSFTLSFHFAPNDYFTNSVLTKTYYLKCEVDDHKPADFDGPIIYRSEASKIEWKEGKDLTVKLVKKKQKNKKNPSAARFVTKQVKADSFFNFFDTSIHDGKVKDEENMDAEDEALLSMDYEIGEIIRSTIVPHALFHFTAEIENDEDDDYDEFDDEDLEDEDGEEDEE